MSVPGPAGSGRSCANTIGLRATVGCRFCRPISSGIDPAINTGRLRACVIARRMRGERSEDCWFCSFQRTFWGRRWISTYPRKMALSLFVTFHPFCCEEPRSSFASRWPTAGIELKCPSYAPRRALATLQRRTRRLVFNSIAHGKSKSFAGSSRTGWLQRADRR
jgi:hypothetical protein